MTFNTTSLVLRRALSDKRLLVREPLRPLANQIRYLLVTPEVDALLDGRQHFGVFPAPAAEILIGRYAAGQMVTVSRKLTDAKPDLERLVGAHEVWALCPRRPPPGWRILGRWFAKDQLVAFRAWDKNYLFRNYPRAAQEVIEDWEELFGAMAPHGGNTVEDYLSGLFKDVDEIA